jgi:hypothetical protein
VSAREPLTIVNVPLQLITEGTPMLANVGTPVVARVLVLGDMT